MAEGTVVLTCWKEIASHLNKTVRTVQRWERELGMPVHRPRGRSSKIICAFPNEIGEWIRATNPEALLGMRQPPVGPPLACSELESILRRHAALVQTCLERLLALREERVRLRVAIAALTRRRPAPLTLDRAPTLPPPALPPSPPRPNGRSDYVC